jgi:hypothetical protein
MLGLHPGRHPRSGGIPAVCLDSVSILSRASPFVTEIICELPQGHALHIGDNFVRHYLSPSISKHRTTLATASVPKKTKLVMASPALSAGY